MKEIPVKDLMMMAGCIAYFVCPTDLIPDWMPALGFTDDAAALTVAFRSVKHVIGQSAKDKAIGKAAGIFGKNFDEEQAKAILSAVADAKKGK